MVELATRRAPAISNTEWLKALPPAARWSFYGSTEARSAAAGAWGVEFSEEACRAHAHTTRATLWLGPDEYLLLDFAAAHATPGQPAAAHPATGPSSTPPAPTAVTAELERALAHVPHALVDISHRQFALEVSGPHAPTILNGACPLDLDLAQFPVGMCTRTVFAKADIVLWRTREDAFHLEVWRSFAGYVTGILSEIAAEFYPAR
jgi:sarcosine oxidase subunit gamma